jgi:hypothetical protein
LGEGLLVAREVVDPMVRQDPGQGSVPPIEDEVEKNYHGGILTEVSYFTGTMLSLMSAAMPPTLPAKDETHDPARVLSTARHERLFNLA